MVTSVLAAPALHAFTFTHSSCADQPVQPLSFTLAAIMRIDDAYSKW